MEEESICYWISFFSWSCKQGNGLSLCLVDLSILDLRKIMLLYKCSCRCLALFCNQKPYIFIYIFWNFVEIFRTLQKYNYSWLFISWWRSYIFSLFRGFLKSDKALGQANIKFEHFNNRCEIHECVDVSILYEA